jgi:hypothetical protein
MARFQTAAQKFPGEGRGECRRIINVSPVLRSICSELRVDWESFRHVTNSHNRDNIRPSLYWDVTSRSSVVGYRRFGTIYRVPFSRVKQIAWPLKMGCLTLEDRTDRLSWNGQLETTNLRSVTSPTTKISTTPPLKPKISDTHTHTQLQLNNTYINCKLS